MHRVLKLLPLRLAQMLHTLCVVTSGTTGRRMGVLVLSSSLSPHCSPKHLHDELARPGSPVASRSLTAAISKMVGTICNQNQKHVKLLRLPVMHLKLRPCLGKASGQESFGRSQSGWCGLRTPAREPSPTQVL